MHDVGYGLTVVHPLGVLPVEADKQTARLLTPLQVSVPLLPLILKPPPHVPVRQVAMIVTPPLLEHPSAVPPFRTIAPFFTENAAPLLPSPSR